MKRMLLCGLLMMTMAGSVYCQSPTISQEHLTHITHIESGLIPEIVIEGSDIPHWTIDERMGHHSVPGLSMVFFDQGQIQWSRTYGYQSTDTSEAVDENTLFQAASISKPVAAMGVLMLSEQGKIHLDSAVNQYLTGWTIPTNRFTAAVPVTPRHLLSHTGGLTVHGFRGYAEGEEVPSIIQILNGESPANSDAIVADTLPGAIWRYSGGGYTIAQKMVEDVSGNSFAAYMKEAVLDRIGMDHSTYQQPLPTDLHAIAAVGYRPDGTEVAGRYHTYPEQAAAGLWTTPTDLARFAINVQEAYSGRGQKPINQETARAMLTGHLSDYGLGLGLYNKADSLAFGHGGSNEGFRCSLFAFANMGQGIALMTNSDNGSRLIGEILRAVSKEYGWNIYNPTVKTIYPLTALEKKAFEGAYAFQADPNIKVNVSLISNDLNVVQLWDEQSYRILPQDKRVFFDENEGNSFEFFVNPDGTMQKLVVNGQFELFKVDQTD